MATVFVNRRRYRVAVNSDDHPPPHVHAFGKGCEARFRLNCPDGPVELWDRERPWARPHVTELGAEIVAKLAVCCAKWREFHG